MCVLFFFPSIKGYTEDIWRSPYDPDAHAVIKKKEDKAEFLRICETSTHKHDQRIAEVALNGCIGRTPAEMRRATSLLKSTLTVCLSWGLRPELSECSAAGCVQR